MRSICALASLALLFPAGSARGGTHGFTDVTSGVGINFVHSTNTGGPRQMAGGAATCDFDLDGWPDLFVTRYDAADILYRNDGLGGFDDDTANAFPAGTVTLSNGAGCADLDNDGDPDLVVTTLYDTRYYLFMNDGSGIFTEDAVARGVAFVGANTYGWSVGFGDYDRDGWIDIFLGEWRREGFEPAGTPSRARLLRNLGPSQPGHFEDTTDLAGVAPDAADPGTMDVLVFSPSFVDMDGDGWQDLVYASDFGTSKIYWNDGPSGTFSDGTAAAMVGTESNGMGSTIGDYNGDGLLDWYVTSIDQTDFLPERDGNRLFENQGDRTFLDVTDAAQVRNGYFGWGTAFFDYDNDGDLDIVETNGMQDNVALGFTPMRLWDNAAGVFTERSAAAGMTNTDHGKGLLTFDYDDDGDLDVFVMNNGAAPVLYQNDYVGSNRYLRIELQGVASNRDAYGAEVWVWETLADPPQVRAVGASTHYLGQSERTLHFGFGSGAANTVELVEIHWPSGRQQWMTEVALGTTHTFQEIEPRRWRCGLLGLEAPAALALASLLSRRRRRRWMVP